MLIDQFLPVYDESKSYETTVRASSEKVYSSLKQIDIHESRIIRGLFFLRGLPALFTAKNNSTKKKLTFDDITHSGFLLLKEKPNEEIVIGVVGQFWKLTGNIRRDVMPEKFSEFYEPGFAKAAWNFQLKEDKDGETQLSTETRIQCFGDDSKKKFKRYWRLIGPFSGVIRKEILKIVKRSAEQEP